VAVVGSAEVEIRATGDKFRSDIKKILASAASDARAAGDDAGKSYGDGFGDGVRGSLQQSLSGVTDDVDAALRDIDSRFRETGENAGSAFDGFDTSGIVSSLDAVDAANRRVGSSGDSSRGSNRRFSDSFRFLTDGAEAARDQLDKLIITGNLLSAALPQLIGVLGAAGTSLVSLAAAAYTAGPSILALGGVIASVLQGFIAFGIAFRGVGEAVSAGIQTISQGTRRAGQSAASQIASVRAIEAAQRRVRDAYQQAADTAVRSAQRVADAERKLAQAVNASRDAQKRLNAAREEGLETLQQLSFSAEDAVLAEERAGLALQDAFAQLQKVASLPPDNRTRIEAELAYKEADLNYRQAKDRAQDLAKEQEAAAKAGVDGTREVIQANNDIADAQNNVIESQQALKEAQEQQRRSAEDSSQAIADSIRQLQLAQQSAAAAAQAARGSVDNYAAALAKLSPAQREFATFIVSLNPLFTILRNSIAEGLFPPLTAALKELFKQKGATSFFGQLVTALTTTGTIVGQFLGKLVGILNNPFFSKLFFDILNDNAEVLEIVGSAFLSVAKVMLVLFKAAGPVTKRFAEWFETLAKGWEKSATGEGALGRLTEAFNLAGQVASLIGGAFGSFFDMFGELAKTALPAGAALLWNFTEAMQTLTGEIKGNKDGLSSYFFGAAENITTILDVLGDFGRALFSIADAPEIGQTFEGLRPLAPIISKILGELVKAGPSFAAAAVSAGKFISTLISSGAVETFFNTISTIFDGLTSFFGSDFGQSILKIAGPILAVLAVFRIFKKFLSFFAKGTIGNLIVAITKLIDNLGKLRSEKPIKIKASIDGEDDDDDDGGGKKGKGKRRKPGRLAKRLAGGGEAALGIEIDAGETQKELDELKEVVLDGVALLRERLKAEMKKVGKAAGDGLEAGVESGPDPFKLGGGMGDDLTKGAEGSLDVKSPSGVFKRIGLNVTKGLVDGINAGESDVSKAAKGLADTLTTPVDNASKGIKGKISGILSKVTGRGKSAAGSDDDDDDSGKPKKKLLGGIRGKASEVGGKVKEKVRGAAKAVGGKAAKGIGKGLKVGALGAIGALVPLLTNPDAINQLGEAISRAAENIPKIVAKIAVEFPKIISKIVENIPALVTALQSSIPKIISAIAAAIPVVIQTLADAIPTVVGAIGEAIPKVFGAIAGALPKLLEAIGGIIPVIIGALTKAFPAIVDAVQKALPVLFKAIGDMLPKILGALTDALPMIIDAIVTNIPIIIDAILGLVDPLLKAFMEALPKLIDLVVKVVPKLITAIVKAIPKVLTALGDALPQVLQTIAAGIPELINGIVSAIPAVIDAIVTALPLIVDAVTKALPLIINAVITAIPTIIDALIKAVPIIIEALKTLVPGIVTSVGALITTLFPPLVEIAKTKLSGIITWFSELPGKVRGFIGTAFGFLGTKAQEAVDWVKNKLLGAKDSLISIITFLPKKYLQAGAAVFNFLKDKLGDAYDWVKNKLTGEKGSLLSYIKELPGNFLRGGQKIFTWIGDKIIDAYNFVKDKLVGDKNSLLSFFKTLPKKIGNVSKNIFAGLYNSFANTINGMIGWWNQLELKIGGFKFKTWFGDIDIPEIKLGTPDINWRVPLIPLAEGGVVRPTTSGTAALLGEAGKAERVTPLNSQGMSPSEVRMLQMMKDMQKQGSRPWAGTVQVFIGNRDITDIVDMRVKENTNQAVRRGNYSRPVR
jgi:phage-related protein